MNEIKNHYSDERAFFAAFKRIREIALGDIAELRSDAKAVAGLRAEWVKFAPSWVHFRDNTANLSAAGQKALSSVDEDMPKLETIVGVLPRLNLEIHHAVENGLFALDGLKPRLDTPDNLARYYKSKPPEIEPVAASAPKQKITLKSVAGKVFGRSVQTLSPIEMDNGRIRLLTEAITAQVRLKSNPFPVSLNEVLGSPQAAGAELHHV